MLHVARIISLKWQAAQLSPVASLQIKKQLLATSLDASGQQYGHNEGSSRCGESLKLPALRKSGCKALGKKQGCRPNA